MKVAVFANPLKLFEWALIDSNAVERDRFAYQASTEGPRSSQTIRSYAPAAPWMADEAADSMVATRFGKPAASAVTWSVGDRHGWFADGVISQLLLLSSLAVMS
jgi:hypothetical protein